MSEKLLQTYSKCSPDERTLLQLISVIYAPVSKSVLLNTARRCGLTGPGGRSYTAISIAETLQRLKNGKLIHVANEGSRCNLQIAHSVTLSAVDDGTFHAMVRTVQMEIPMVSEWGNSYYRTPEHALRDVRVAFYQHDARQAFEALKRYERQFPYDVIRAHPFVSICYTPFDPRWFRTLPDELQIAALKEILRVARRNFLPSEAPFQVLAELAKRGGVPPWLQDLFHQELFLRGSLTEAAMGAQEGGGWKERALLACSRVTKGESLAAVELFEEALAGLKKETGKRKTFFDDFTGLLFIVALIGAGNPKLLARADEFCTYVTGRKEWPYQDIYEALQLVIRERNGEQRIAERLEGQLYRIKSSPLHALFFALALHWCGSKEAAREAEALAAEVKRAREAGYHWVADELELAMQASDIGWDAIKIQESYQEQGLIPLHSAVQQTESWANALGALMKLTMKDEPAPQKRISASRLIWHFEETGRTFNISPREQKQTATGKWTSGKDISLKRLAEDTSQFDFLTDQDRAICACIRKERERSYGYYGYGREVYRLDPDRALLAMIGHPHVYLDRAASVPLELVHGEPELQLTAEGADIQLQMYPPFDQEQGIYLLKESQTRLKVFEAREDYRKVAAIVGSGLKVPAKAKDKVLEAINLLSSIMTVHSDIGSESAETVAADPTPCFHLLPYNAGVKLQLLVRPFADAGPYFLPGAGGETVMAELDGKRVQAKRDLRGEVRRAADAVASISILPETEEETEWLIPSPDAALELLWQLQSLGDQVRVAWPEGAKFKVRQEAGPRNLKLSVRQAKDWFELEGEVRLNEGVAVDLQQLVKLATQATGRFIQLGEGDFLALSAQLKKRLDDLAGFADPHGKGFRFHPLAAGVFEELAGEAGEFSCDSQWQRQLQRLREAQAFLPQVPTTLQAELRSYQEEGFNWLNRLAHWGVGACLADDMGLGKTVQALAQILSMAGSGPSLVIAPTSVCLNWESEARRFAPTLNVIVFGGSRRKESLQRLKPFDLVICSYGLLQQEGEMLSTVEWQAVVLDEAQAIKNMATKRSQAAMELRGTFKMVATGTPIENHLGELWNVFRFINPGLLGSLKQFNLKFAYPIEKSQDKKARARLKKLIQPFILRRTKNQVLDELPSRTEITIKVEMGEQEASFYEAVRKTALDSLAGIDKVEGKAQTHIKILAEIMRLRRACCNPCLILPESNIPSAKLDAFGEIVQELRENRHKALVFSQFVGHLEIIRKYVERAGIPYQYLDGSTPAAERKKRVDAFQSGDGDLFLISLKAGGVGLNLTAADYVIHMDPWWNPAVEDQASDRAHRIGQQRPVTIYRLVCKGTVEEKIVGLHQQKRGLADSLLDETDISGKMTAEELLQLLRPQSS